MSRIYNEQSVRDALKHFIKERFKTQREAAKYLGVGESYLGEALRGDINMPVKLANAIGWFKSWQEVIK